MTQGLFNFDKQFGTLICGIDEVGRGPLAGPVVAAAVIMPMNNFIDGIFDSKKLSKLKREQLSEKILKQAIDYRIAEISNHEIDEINILNATIKAMQTAVDALKITPQIILVDAVKGLTAPCEIKSIIKGDSTSYNIAAASIIAKVYRDNLMADYCKKYPEYDFSKNCGYGTKRHIEAIKKYGKLEIHRESFCRNL